MSLARRGLEFRRPAGFSLMEVLLSTTILGIIFGVMGSVMLLARRNMAIGAVASDEISGGNAVARQISTELAVATTVTERTANSITFTVPDRNGDASPETIRYAWSGVAGAPLTRSYNGSTAVTVAQNVYYFNLDYIMRAASGP